MQIQEPRFYSPHRATRNPARNLPHWEQEGVCAFVTMRLADSLPKQVILNHEASRKQWLKLRGFNPELPEALILDQLSPKDLRSFRRFTSSKIHRSLDKCHGSCVLKDPDVRRIVETSIRYGHTETYTLYSFVIMPNHVHLLFQPMPGQSMKKLLSTMRRVSARNVNRQLGRTGELWQAEPFDHLVRSRHWFDRYRTYIRLNPARAHLGGSAYTWWEA